MTSTRVQASIPFSWFSHSANSSASSAQSSSSESEALSRLSLAQSARSSATSPALSDNADHHQQLAQSAPRVALSHLSDDVSNNAAWWAYVTQSELNRITYALTVEPYTSPSLHDGPGLFPCYKCKHHISGTLAEVSTMACSSVLEPQGKHYIDDKPLWRLSAVDDECHRRLVAIDGEFIYTTHGHELAHLVIVDEAGAELASWYLRPAGEIVDLLTPLSGITDGTALLGPDALELGELPSYMARLGIGSSTCLVGHGLESDFAAMRLERPTNVIDSALLYPVLGRSGRWQRAKLAHLARDHLDLAIQTGSHDPLEDARAALMLVRGYVFGNLVSYGGLRPTAELLGIPVPVLGALDAQAGAKQKPKCSHNRRAKKTIKAITCHACGRGGHKKADCRRKSVN